MVEKIVGYVLEGHDNDTYLIDKTDTSIQRCPNCGYRTNFQLSNPCYEFTKPFSPAYMDIIVTPENDLSVTYDGQVIVTKKFKEFCRQQQYSGLDFVNFTLDKKHFHLFVSIKVEIDLLQGATRFNGLCSVCNNYASVTQGSEFLQENKPLSDGFYSTNLLFGSGNAKSPAIIVGRETKLKLEAAGMVGLVFTPAYGL